MTISKVFSFLVVAGVFLLTETERKRESFSRVTSLNHFVLTIQNPHDLWLYLRWRSHSDKQAARYDGSGNNAVHKCVYWYIHASQYSEAMRHGAIRRLIHTRHEREHGAFSGELSHTLTHARNPNASIKFILLSQRCVSFDSIQLPIHSLLTSIPTYAIVMHWLDL